MSKDRQMLRLITIVYQSNFCMAHLHSLRMDNELTAFDNTQLKVLFVNIEAILLTEEKENDSTPRTVNVTIELRLN